MASAGGCPRPPPPWCLAPQASANPRIRRSRPAQAGLTFAPSTAPLRPRQAQSVPIATEPAPLVAERLRRRGPTSTRLPHTRFPHACRLLTLAPSRGAGLAGASLARALAVCSVSPASIATAHSSPSARRCSRPPVHWRPAACSCGGGEAAPALAAGCGVVGRVHAGSGRHLRARERPASMASARGCPRPPPPWCLAPQAGRR